MVDHPHVDAVVLALLNGRADALDVLGVTFATAPRIGRDPGPEFQLRHREYLPGIDEGSGSNSTRNPAPRRRRGI